MIFSDYQLSTSDLNIDVNELVHHLDQTLPQLSILGDRLTSIEKVLDSTREWMITERQNLAIVLICWLVCWYLYRSYPSTRDDFSVQQEVQARLRDLAENVHTGTVNITKRRVQLTYTSTTGSNGLMNLRV